MPREEHNQMTTWHEYVQQHGTVPPWPYPVRYGARRSSGPMS